NAIARREDDGTITAQFQRVRTAMRDVATLVCEGPEVVMTHGNGPVVGNIVLRGEIAGDTVPPMPLFIAGADSEGGIGLMLQQVLGNELRSRGSDCMPATVVTQVVVDPHDAAFANPTKPIGPPYARAEAIEMAARRGWRISEQPDGTWRRVVASPRPLEIVEAPAVDALLRGGFVPIAAGGGGVPVRRDADGSLHGCDAVVDKDWSSAVLARQVGAQLLVILMEAPAVFSAWGTAEPGPIARLTAQEASVLAGTLPQGGIGPKVAAAAWFARHGGRSVIGRSEDLRALVSSDTGTVIES
ncbi:MAG: carbamate kinase, partial [Coriobacteriia bacterium]|nr:carbamate kinase [Coriobacteriia bacterium]